MMGQLEKSMVGEWRRGSQADIPGRLGALLNLGEEKGNRMILFGRAKNYVDYVK